MRRLFTSSLAPLLRCSLPRFQSVSLRFIAQTPVEERQILTSSSSQSEIEDEVRRSRKGDRFKSFQEVLNHHPELKESSSKLSEEEKQYILSTMNISDEEDEVLQMEENPSPDSPFLGPESIQWLQTNPTYQASLEQAVQRNYKASLTLMWVAYQDFFKTLGPCTEHLLYIIRRIIWIGRLAGAQGQNLSVAEKAYNIARELFSDPQHQEKLRFYQQLLINHCFLFDTSKALLVVQNALKRRANLKERDILGDMKLLFYEAVSSGQKQTATALTGDLEQAISKSQTLYENIGRQIKHLGKDSEKLLSGTLLNLAVMKFEQVKAEGDQKALNDEQWTEEELRKNGKAIQECIFLFKAAINIAENVPERFGIKEGEEGSKVQKIFKELFNPSEKRFIGVQKPAYSLKERVENDALIQASFTTKEAALAVMNLGYMAHHMQAPSQALIYLDIATRAFAGIEGLGSLHGKAMGYLAASFGQLHGNQRLTRELFEKVLEKAASDSIERAETLFEYGKTLIREEATRYEGEEMIEESCKIEHKLGNVSPIKRLMVYPEVSKEI